MASSLNPVVDPFAVAAPGELPDWRLPLSFMKARHLEKIEASGETEEWRMKDRVRRRERGRGGGGWGEVREVEGGGGRMSWRLVGDGEVGMSRVGRVRRRGRRRELGGAVWPLNKTSVQRKKSIHT